jgi:hypothetical protein
MKMDVRAIVELVKQTPEVQRAVDIIEAQLERAPIMPEDLDEIIGMLEAVVQDPNRYPEVRAAAVKDGVISEQDAPQEYDPTFVLAVLVALYGYRERLSTKGYARGGLKVAGRQLAAAGRGGDSMLAHINPREAEMLRRMGGSGTVNPNTGLREYKSGKGLLGALLPIALNFIAPGLGGIIGTALGATGTAATMLGSAVIGGVSSALTGGDPLKGALMGGLGGGLSGAVGSAASNTLKLGLGETGQALLGGALVGGTAGALTGDGFVRGALQGAAGSGLSKLAGGFSGPSAFEKGISQAGQTMGQALTAGFDPKTAAITGGLSGLASGVQTKLQSMKPSDNVVANLKAPGGGSSGQLTSLQRDLTGRFYDAQPGSQPSLTGATDLSRFGSTSDYSALTRPGGLKVNAVDSLDELFAPDLTKSGYTSDYTAAMQRGLRGPQPAAVGTESAIPSGGESALPGLNLKTAGTLALLSSLSASRPPEVNAAIEKMSPAQQEYFNRPSIKWDWNKLQSDANAQQMSLSQYMSTYWPQIAAGTYSIEPAAMAMGGMYAMGGGPLGAVARLVRGGGSGRDDTINARLSDGEYVMDAETVAMLGDGSADEGARRLDGMRAQLRKHKGKTLARGKFSPNAKSPLAYMKGAA